MENPTNKGRASCVRFADASHEAFTTTTYRAQILAAKYALPIETAVLVAALAFGGSHG